MGDDKWINILARRYDRIIFTSCTMGEPITITSSDPILGMLAFKPYRNMVERRVVLFMPEPDKPQTMEIVTPWGTQLTAKAGDFLISEMSAPNDAWPIDPIIFDESYIITRPGFCAKKATTMLVPLVELTGGDEDQLITIFSLEGAETVRAGDFFLARGVRGEIWPYPISKANQIMRPIE